MKYYLAYGSNLNVRQMQMRCPGAKKIDSTTIKDFQLLFKGSKTGSYLTIEKKKGGMVPVGIWEVNEEHEASLDRYEGYPHFYYKVEGKLPGVPHEEQDAFIYIMHEERKLGLPSDDYVEVCKVGYENFGFDEKYLKEALRISKEEALMKQEEHIERVCPKCGQTYFGYPAISREDNETLICPDCGIKEALESIGVCEEEQNEIVSVIHKAEEEMNDKNC